MWTVRTAYVWTVRTAYVVAVDATQGGTPTAAYVWTVRTAYVVAVDATQGGTAVGVPWWTAYVAVVPYTARTANIARTTETTTHVAATAAGIPTWATVLTVMVAASPTSAARNVTANVTVLQATVQHRKPYCHFHHRYCHLCYSPHRIKYVRLASVSSVRIVNAVQVSFKYIIAPFFAFAVQAVYSGTYAHLIVYFCSRLLATDGTTRQLPVAAPVPRLGIATRYLPGAICR